MEGISEEKSAGLLKALTAAYKKHDEYAYSPGYGFDKFNNTCYKVEKDIREESFFRKMIL